MAGSARTIRVEVEPAIAASAAVIIVLRSIIATSCAIRTRQISPTGARPLLNKALWSDRREGAPWQRQQRHINPVPFAYRFRPPAHEGVFYRLGLADGDMQPEQDRGEGIGPFVKAQIPQRIEQDCACEDDQGIGEDEIFGFQSAP